MIFLPLIYVILGSRLRIKMMHFIYSSLKEMTMIDKIQDVIERAKRLPPSEQEELLTQIEVQLERLEKRVKNIPSQSWRDLAGAWADLPDTVDEMFDALDTIRHSSPPSPPLELP
jgi:hypothetical protein